MACFNDENNVLIFIGFYSYLNFSSSIFEEKYINNFDENFTSFIDQYYDEHDVLVLNLCCNDCKKRIFN